jgi:hypothetical protein
MGRTIPSFRIAAVLEEKEWKQYRKYLNNKKDRKTFDNMFSIGTLYNSACSNAVNPIRIYPILMSIILHHYKMLKEQTSSFVGFDNSGNDETNDIYDNNNIHSKILNQELDKWYNFSFVLRKQNRELFKQMLQSSYKHSSSIDAKGKEFSTESLLISLIFEQHKMLINAVNNNKLDCYL